MSLRLALALAAVLAAACDASSDPPADVARIEIGPAAVALIGAGDVRPIAAQAFDADGEPVEVALEWRSSRESIVTVDANGQVTGHALGASSVTASIGDLVTTPVFVTVIEVAPGVVVLDDARIVEPPRVVDPDVDEDLDAELEAVLRMAQPAPGTRLLGRESIPIGGEVLSAIAEGETSRVRLRMVPLAELVTGARLDEVMDGAAIPAEIPEALAEAYDIEEIDGELVFTPKPGARLPAPAPALALAPGGGGGGTTTIDLPPIGTCETAGSALPISLGQLPTFTAKIDSTYQLVYDTTTGKKRLVALGEASAKLQLNLVVNVDALVSVECTLKLYSKVFKAPGWAGLILAGELVGGEAFELEGRINAFNAGAEVAFESKARFEIGIDCLGDECDMVKTITPESKTTVRWLFPSLGQIRIDPSFFAYGFVGLKLGATLLEKLRIETVKLKAGGKLEASLSLEALQTEPDQDPDYRSSYKLSALAEIGAGKRVTGLLAKLGIVKFNALKLTLSSPLGTSPKGSVTASRGSFAVADLVRFHVQLDPASVEFPFVGYNVEKVRILHKRTGSLAPVEVATIDAAAGQVDFDLTWTADVSSIEAGATFFAFVDTMLPSGVDLELAQAVVVPAAPGGEACLPPAGKSYCATPVVGDILALTESGNLLLRDGVGYRTIIDGVSALLPAGLAGKDMNEAGEVLVDHLVPDPSPGGTTLRAVSVLAGAQLTRVATEQASLEVSGVAINDAGDVAVATERDATALEDQALDRSTMAIGMIARRDGEGVYQRQIYPGGEFEERRVVAISDSGTGLGALTTHASDGSGSSFSTFLALPGGATSVPGFPDTAGPVAINVHDEIVASDAHVWFAGDGVVSQLPDVSGQNAVPLLDLNDDGVIVGTADLGGGAFTGAMWIGPAATPVALTSLVHPDGEWRIEMAKHINNAGVISAIGASVATGLTSVLLVPATRANLSISIIAPAEVPPEAAVTYAVNLRNFGPAPTSDLRAEFSLPTGFTVVGTTGWQQCETIGTTVTCRASSLASGEQRAFLVDVLAPLGEGEFTVSARVLSGTSDPDFADNERTATTIVTAPGRQSSFRR